MDTSQGIESETNFDRPPMGDPALQQALRRLIHAGVTGIVLAAVVV